MTKFEVGKKYIHTMDKPESIEYTCEAIIYGSVVLSWRTSDGYKVEALAGGYLEGYTEVPPPLTFGDLKVGEKFKWVKPRDCGDVVCMRIHGVCTALTSRVAARWVALEGKDIGTAWATNDEDKVIRVE